MNVSCKYWIWVLLLIFTASAVNAVSYTWTPTDSGTYNWDNSGSQNNWSSGFPNGVNDEASLNISFDGNQTINLNQTITVGSINIGDQNDTRYAYTIAAGTAGSFVFDASAGTAALTRTGGNGVQDLISANVLLNTNLVVSDATGTLNWGVDQSIKFSGIISGNGSITKIGSGALSLEGANTYSGGLIISNGYLQIRHANAAGKGPFVIGTPECASPIPWINMHNGAGVTITNEVILIGDYISHQGFNCTGPIRLARSGIQAQCNMSGSGLVTDLNGSNTLNGLDINLYGVGGWGGTLNLSANILMYTNQTMTHDSGWGVSSWQGVISGVISDGGNGYSLTKAGTAGTYLNGANTYSGDTSVSAGRLLLGNNLALQNSAMVTVSGGFAIGSGITTPTIGGLKGSVDLTNTFASGYSGSVTNLTLNPGAGKTNTYSGKIDNGAAGMTLTKTGAGTQILSGTNSYTGATAVNGGRLIVNGSITNNVTVGAEGAFGGSGTVGGNVRCLSGGDMIFYPTDSLTITGTLILDGSNTVYLIVPEEFDAGRYTLASFNPSGSSGVFIRKAVVVSGSCKGPPAITTDLINGDVILEVFPLGTVLLVK